MKDYKFAGFWDRLADRYSKKPVPDQQVYEKKLEITRRYLQPHMQVLEIGCGTGTTALLQAPFVSHVYATDFSSAMIEIANRKAADQGVRNVTFEQSSIDDLELTGNSLDVVMGHNILHLLDNPAEVIARVYETLKPGGAFVTSTVCLGNKLGFFRYIAPVGRFLRVLPVLNVFSADELEQFFVDAGFQIDYQWRQDDGNNSFIVAVKPEH